MQQKPNSTALSVNAPVVVVPKLLCLAPLLAPAGNGRQGSAGSPQSGCPKDEVLSGRSAAVRRYPGAQKSTLCCCPVPTDVANRHILVWLYSICCCRTEVRCSPQRPRGSTAEDRGFASEVAPAKMSCIGQRATSIPREGVSSRRATNSKASLSSNLCFRYGPARSGVATQHLLFLQNSSARLSMVVVRSCRAAAVQ